MKVKLDENITSAATSLLDRYGHDCDTVADEGLVGTADPKLMAACRREQRMLITFDLGFGDIRVYPPSTHPGVVVLRLRDQQPAAVLQVLEKLLAAHDLDDLTSRLTVVTDERIRIRTS